MFEILENRKKLLIGIGIGGLFILVISLGFWQYWTITNQSKIVESINYNMNNSVSNTNQSQSSSYSSIRSKFISPDQLNEDNRKKSELLNPQANSQSKSTNTNAQIDLGDETIQQATKIPENAADTTQAINAQEQSALTRKQILAKEPILWDRGDQAIVLDTNDQDYEPDGYEKLP